MNDDLGKKAEDKIKSWLDRPDEGYCFDRIPDQMTGFYGSKNICDFTLFKCPNYYYIESKATWEDRFDFSRITEYQMIHMLEKSKIPNVFSIIIILFAAYKKAILMHIDDINYAIKHDIKSINIKRIEKCKVPYTYVPTIESKKVLLDYTGEIEDLI